MKKYIPHTEKFSVVDVMPGEKCNNGGEYGFWTEYLPVQGNAGWFYVFSNTTCDFDPCGTGYEGVEMVSEERYEELMAQSARIESEGSLY